LELGGPLRPEALGSLPTLPKVKAGTGQKGTSWVEAITNNEKNKLVALAIIKLYLSEGIDQLVSQLFSQLESPKNYV